MFSLLVETRHQFKVSGRDTWHLNLKSILINSFRAVSHLIRRLCYVTVVKLLLYKGMCSSHRHHSHKGASAPVLVSVVATSCELILLLLDSKATVIRRGQRSSSEI
ncbi:hypothetical protein Rs2_21594 [Raphanus sativus]|nr:hypothetical protein Rs2_21594 [Raphanus sativus]